MVAFRVLVAMTLIFAHGFSHVNQNMAGESLPAMRLSLVSQAEPSAVSTLAL
jgi:hypothetical protein